MPLEFSSTAAPIDDAGVKMLVYGPAGAGKTVLNATLPGSTVIISAEAGLLSLQPANQVRMFGKSRDIPVIIIRNGDDFRLAYEMISSADGASLESVGIDSLSEIAEVVLAAELAKSKDGRMAYGNMNEIMLKYIRLFRDLRGKHVYMSAKQDREKDDKGVMLYGPSMPGKTLTQQVAHFFDEVFFLGITEATPSVPSYRFLRTRANLQYLAKDRSGALDEIEQPDLSVVINKIRTK